MGGEAQRAGRIDSYLNGQLVKIVNGEYRPSSATIAAGGNGSGPSRTVNFNAVTDLPARIRGRYALLSLIYNLSRFKAGK